MDLFSTATENSGHSHKQIIARTVSGEITISQEPVGLHPVPKTPS
jgi:hypothetical protein